MRLGGIVDYQNATRPFVINFTKRFVTLLPGSIPQGDFDILVAHLYNFGEKLDADGGLLTLVELVADVASGYVGLACACRTNYHNFEHLVVLVHFVRKLIINLLVQKQLKILSKSDPLKLIDCRRCIVW